jgi:TrmH family RNA methyltransferase
MNLDNIKIIMVGTTHSGNIGAAARAMNNMCISNLVLVDPKCPVGEIAYGRASGANTVLDQRTTVSSLGQALGDCELVIATSARRRSLTWPELDPTQMADKLFNLDADARVALVFGREHSGLTNDELQMCNYMVCIPTNPDFSSLNVASAVQVICYEIYRRFGGVADVKLADAEKVSSKVPDEDELPATSGEVEGYFEHLDQVLISTRFLNPANPGITMQRLRRLYMRCGLSRNEINILRGMLSAVEKYKR